MSVFIYLIKSAAILGLFYGVYWVVLRKQTLFIANRHYLISGILAALILPLVTYTQTVYLPAPELTNSLSNSALVSGGNSSPLPIVEEPFNWGLLLLSIYGLGVLFCSLRFGYYSYKLLSVLKGCNFIKSKRFYFVETTHDIPPFSFFKYIVYNPKMHSKVDLEMILKHEKVHASGWHSVDVLLGQLLTIIHWLNPVAWLYQKAVIQNLEFLADENTVKQIESKKAYQLALVKASTQNQKLVLGNSFYQSFIKNRIVMLNTNQTRKVNRWKLLLVVPLLALFMYSFNVRETYEYLEPEHTDNSMINIAPELVINASSTNKDLDIIEQYFQRNYSDVALVIKKRAWDGGKLSAYTLDVDFPSLQSSGSIMTYKAINGVLTPVRINYKPGPEVFVTELNDSGKMVSVNPESLVIHDPEVANELAGLAKVYSKDTSTKNNENTADNYALSITDSTLYVVNNQYYTTAQLPKDKTIVTKGSITLLDPKEGLAKYGDAGKYGAVTVNGSAKFVAKETAASIKKSQRAITNNTKDIVIVISSDMTRDMLEEKQAYLKAEHNVDMDFSNLEYNADNQIIGITLKVATSKSNSSFSINDNDQPIEDIILTIDEDGSMSVSSAGNNARSLVRKEARLKEMKARKYALQVEKEKRLAEMKVRKAELASMSEERKLEMKAQMEARKAELKARSQELKLREKELIAKKRAIARSSARVGRAGRSKARSYGGNGLVITKNTTDAELALLQEKLASKNVDFNYKRVKRNAQGEIVGIKITVDNNDGSKSTTTVNGDQDEPIEEIYLEY